MSKIRVMFAIIIGLIICTLSGRFYITIWVASANLSTIIDEQDERPLI